MPDTLGTSVSQSVMADTLEPQVLSQKSEKGVITLARRGKRGKKR